MGRIDTDRNGERDESVKLVLGEKNLRSFESYVVSISVLQQPAAFSARLSAGSRLAREVIREFPLKTPFTLYMGQYRQFTGEIDAVEVAGDDGSTSVTFRGRDMLARLVDADIDAERSYENVSLEALLQAALDDVGSDRDAVDISNEATRRIRSGARVKVSKSPVTEDEVRRVRTGGGERIVVTAQLGESWLTFLQRHLAKQGLFIWTDANGDFILSRPDKDQPPIYRFFRTRGTRSSACNVRRAHFVNDSTRRFSEVVVYARSGGKRFGRNHIHGGFVDQEMVDLGYSRRRVYRDANVTTATEAAAYAARKVGEANRASWKLVYTLSGHSAPLDPSVGGGRGIIVPDTVAYVEDDELGIKENLYIESVEHRSPPRETTVTFMRPRDLVFGSFS